MNTISGTNIHSFITGSLHAKTGDIASIYTISRLFINIAINRLSYEYDVISG